MPKAFKTTIEVWTSYDPKGLLPAEILSGPINITRVTHVEEDKYALLCEVLAAKGMLVHFETEAPTRDEAAALHAKYQRGE